MLLLIIGLALILIGTVLLILPEKRAKGVGDSREDSREDNSGDKSAKIKGGAVVMIGPIPLVVGSDSRTALLMMLIALAIMILWTLPIKGG